MQQNNIEKSQAEKTQILRTEMLSALNKMTSEEAKPLFDQVRAQSHWKDETREFWSDDRELAVKMAAAIAFYHGQVNIKEYLGSYNVKGLGYCCN